MDTQQVQAGCLQLWREQWIEGFVLVPLHSIQDHTTKVGKVSWGEAGKVSNIIISYIQLAEGGNVYLPQASYGCDVIFFFILLSVHRFNSCSSGICILSFSMD